MGVSQCQIVTLTCEWVETHLLWRGSSLGSDQLLQIPNGIIRTALDSNCESDQTDGRGNVSGRFLRTHAILLTLPTQTIICSDLNESWHLWAMTKRLLRLGTTECADCIQHLVE